MATKGLLLGTGLIAWALWRGYWPNDLLAEAGGIFFLVVWFVLVWLTTISRYVLFYGSISLRRCMILGMGMSVTAMVVFSCFLWLQSVWMSPIAPAISFSDTIFSSADTYILLAISTLALTWMIAAINWWSSKWQHPDGMDI